MEMALKSFTLSKLVHQMSKSWKRSVTYELQTTSKFDPLKNWVHDCSAQGRKSFLTQNMSSRCTSSPVGKIRILDWFLPLPSKLVRLTNPYLSLNLGIYEVLTTQLLNDPLHIILQYSYIVLYLAGLAGKKHEKKKAILNLLWCRVYLEKTRVIFFLSKTISLFDNLR